MGQTRTCPDEAARRAGVLDVESGAAVAATWIDLLGPTPGELRAQAPRERELASVRDDQQATIASDRIRRTRWI